MSKVKEQRIVEMKFDNKDFEKNAKESMNTLDDLEGKLKFEGAKKGAKNIENALNGINVEKLNEALDKINYRFSTVGITMTTMLQKAVGSLGGKIGEIFATIKQKGTARALNLEKARFLLNGITQDAEKTAAVIDGPVNEAVAGTRFGLDEAALSASTLFASGITDTSKGGGLEKSLKAIATAATMTNTEFSEMAQIFSTVKSNGKIMTDQVRQFNFRGLNMYQELAKVYGKTEAEMTEMVSKGKVGYNDLIEAMQHFGDVSKKANETFEGALSNVKAALGRIGVLYEADKLEALRRVMVALIDGPKAPLNAFKTSLEDASRVLGHAMLYMANTTAKMLKNVHVFNALTEAGQSLRHVMTALYIIAGDIGEAFKIVFPQGMLAMIEEIGQGLNDIVEVMMQLVVSFRHTGVFRTFFDILKTGGRIITGFFTAISPLINLAFGMVTALGQTLNWLGTRISLFIERFREVGVLEGFVDVINAILGRILPTGNAFVEFAKKVRSSLTKMLPRWSEYKDILIEFTDFLHRLADAIRTGSNIGNLIRDMFGGVDATLEPVRINLDEIGKKFGTLGKVVDKACTTIHDSLAKIFGRKIEIQTGKFGGRFDDINFSLEGLEEAFGHLFNIVKKVWPYIREVMLWIFSYKVADGAQRIGKGVEGIGKAFSKAGDLIQGFGEKTGLLEKKQGPMEKVFDAMKKLAVSVLILAAAMWVVAQIPEKDWDRSVKSIIAFIVVLTSAIGIAKMVGLMDNKVVASFGLSMLLIALAMRNIARAMVIISKIPVKDIEKTLNVFKYIVIAIGALLLVMGAAGRLSGLMKEDVITRLGVSMLLIANAMLVISIALGIMALAAHYSEGFDAAVDAMIKMFVCVGALMAVVGALGFINGAEKTMVAAGVAIFAIATAMLGLAASVAVLGLLPVPVIIQGLTAIRAIIIMVGIMVAVLEALAYGTNGKALYGAAAALLAVAVAINLLVVPLTILGALDYDVLTQGLFAVCVMIIALGAALALINISGDSATSILAAGASMLIIAAAMLVLTASIQQLADVAANDQLLASMAAFVVAIIAMTGALKILAMDALSALIGAGALTLLSAGIWIFAQAMNTLSQVDLLKAAGGLVEIAIAFTVFGAAIFILTSTGILEIISVGLGMFSIALGAFAIAAILGGVALIAIGKGLEFCAKGIKSFNGADPTEAINALKAFAEAFNVVEAASLGAIALEIFALGVGLMMIAGTATLAGLGINVFAAAMDRLIKIDIATGEKNVARMANTFINFSSAYDEVRLMGDAINTLAAAVFSIYTNIPGLITSLQDLTIELEDAATAWSSIDFGPFIDQLGKIAIEINNKIISQIHQFVETGKYIVDGIKMGMAEKAQELYNEGVAMGNLINQGVMDALGIASPSKEMIKNGHYAAEGLMMGTEDYEEVVRKQGIKLGNALIFGVRTSTASGSKDFRKFLNGVNASMGKFMKSQKLSAYSTLGTQLYMKSDEYKDNVKDLKEYYREYNQIYRDSQEQLKKTKQGSEDDRNKAINAYNQDIDRLNDLEKEMAKIAKKIEKGPKKAIDELWKSIKNTVTSMISISNLNYQSIFNGLQKMEKTTELGQNADTFLSGLSGSLQALATVAKATSDKFDLLNTSYNTGINLLEKFSKVSTVTTRRLFVNAKSQLAAYKETRDAIAKMREMGFNEDLVDSLEAQGTAALGELRGFIKMGQSQVDQYNNLYEESENYKTEVLEKNMKKQMNDYEEFYADLEILAARGLSEGIINRLKDAGIEKAAFVKALLGLDNFDDVEKWYKESVEATNDVSTAEEAMKESFTSLSDWFEYNIEKQNEWTNKLSELRSAGVDERLIKQFEDMGRENGMAYVDSALEEIKNPNHVQKINDAYEELFKSGQKDPAKVMLENITTSNNTVAEYEKNMKKLAKLLPGGRNDPVYKQIEDMGLEAGAEYAKAFVEADKATQQAIIDQMQEREKLEQQELRRQWQRKIDQIKQFKEDTEKLQKLAKAGNISKSLANELIAMGPEYAEEIHRITTMPEKDLKKWSKDYTWAVKNLGKEVATDTVDSMASIAGTATESFANVLSEKNISSITKEALKGIDTKANKSAAKSGGKSVGTSASEGLGKGLEGGTSKAITSWKDSLSKSILDMRNDKNLLGSVDDLGDGLIDRLAKKFGLIEEKVIRNVDPNQQTDKTKQKQTLQETKLDTTKKGSQIAGGVNVGIKSAKKDLLSSGEFIVDTVDTGVKSKAKIKSPSRLMAERGMYLVMGLAKGVSDNVRYAEDAATSIVDAFSNSLDQSVQDIQNGTFGMSDFSIDISPNTAMFDLSNNVAQAAQIQDIFDSISGINLELGRDANRDVVTAINDMRSDFQGQFDTLSQTISEMQLVMDSGALVGQIANPMNEALGERVALAQRGVLA